MCFNIWPAESITNYVVYHSALSNPARIKKLHFNMFKKSLYTWIMAQHSSSLYIFYTDMCINFFRFVIVDFGKSILQVLDTGTRVLDNTGPFLRSSIVSFWITPARSKERKYHIFRQHWYTKNVPVFTNTGTFQYLGPEVYFFLDFGYEL